MIEGTVEHPSDDIHPYSMYRHGKTDAKRKIVIGYSLQKMKQNDKRNGVRDLGGELRLDHQNTLPDTSRNNSGTNLSKGLGSFASNGDMVFGQQRLQLRIVTLGRHPP